MARLDREKHLVLMVDDSEDDCLQLRITLGKSDRMRFIGSVSDGEELLWYMKGEGKYVDRDKYPLPDKLVLDLALPQKEGGDSSCGAKGLRDQCETVGQYVSPTFIGHCDQRQTKRHDNQHEESAGSD